MDDHQSICDRRAGELDRRSFLEQSALGAGLWVGASCTNEMVGAANGEDVVPPNGTAVSSEDSVQAMVLNNSEDPLFTLAEMRRADTMLSEIYAKAKASDAYEARFYPGPHKFDVEMQAAAFAWFDRWLKGC